MGKAYRLIELVSLSFPPTIAFSEYLCFSIAPSSLKLAMNLRMTLNSWSPCCLPLCCAEMAGVHYHRAYAVLRIESWALYMLGMHYQLSGIPKHYPKGFHMLTNLTESKVNSPLCSISLEPMS